jgi:hypothetical protein
VLCQPPDAVCSTKEDAMNLQSWKHRIVTKLTLLLASSLTLSLLTCRRRVETKDIVTDGFDLFKALLGVD